MLKAGIKRRRSKNECEQERLEAQLKQEAEEAKSQRLQKLEQMLAAAEREAESNAAAANILQDMVNQGVLEQNVDGTVGLNTSSPLIATAIDSPFASKRLDA